MPHPKGRPAWNRGLREAAAARFARHVREDESGCHLWTGATVKSSGGIRYGSFRLSPEKNVRAHRYAFELGAGRAPLPGLMVLHTCDVGLCVRFEHLYEGTAEDNARDRDTRGRGNPPAGERSSAAKLTAETADAIRAAYAETPRPTQSVLAARHGVTQSAVSRVVNGLVHRTP